MACRGLLTMFVLKYGFACGVSGFLLGFLGPMILAPDANQGPMLGIFITGPLGFILGVVLGFVFKIMMKRKPDFKHPLHKYF